MKRFVLVSVLLMFVFVSLGTAQSKFQVGVNFVPMFPQGGFKDQIDGMGWGGALNFTYRIPRSILSVGASLGYYIYGYRSRFEPLSMTIPDVLVKVSTTNAVVTGHVFIRLQPLRGSLQPYLDGLVGFQHLTTDTRIHLENDYDDGYPSSNHWRDTVLSYGLGGGLMILLTRQSQNRSRFSVSLDMGFRYLMGGSAEYLTKDAIEVIGDEVFYYVSESRTDIATARFGVIFSF
ncbi:hypothetical protein ACFLT9_08890 [Acidobacteriota bacterium]